MRDLNEWKQWMQSHSDVLIDLIRMYLGVGLLIKGTYFLSHGEALTQLLQGVDNPVFVQAAAAHYVIPVHLIGGLLLALGLMTRVAALLQIPILIGAIFLVHLPQMMLVGPRQNLEFTLLVLFLLLGVAAHGAGRFSVDYLLSRKQARSLQAQA